MTDLAETSAPPCRHRIQEELTIYSAKDQKTALIASLRSCDELELDLASVGEIDTAGLQVLLLVKAEADKHGKVLRLINHSEPVIEVLDLLGMVSYFGDPVVIPGRRNP